MLLNVSLRKHWLSWLRELNFAQLNGDLSNNSRYVASTGIFHSRSSSQFADLFRIEPGRPEVREIATVFARSSLTLTVMNSHTHKSFCTNFFIIGRFCMD